MLGRLSGDIIKKGGYKISALEIECVLSKHPKVGEVCVFGISDPKYGEDIYCQIVPKYSSLTIEEMQVFAMERMSSYKVPKDWKLVESIPKNALGKVNKKELRQSIEKRAKLP
mmetsp:Transcript_29620/g.22018  ORF Transcript_29620/g.22018 Transcript_29620/m.22018 type:complete len:113 (-) Transcript_29620:16-354(-)